MHWPELNFRRRIAGLKWARRGVWLLPVLALAAWRSVGSLALAVVVALVLSAALRAWEDSLRRQFIREASLPAFLVGKLRKAFPQLTARDAELVLRGLRQFFMAHLRSGRKFVAMPSKVVDEAWHDYILHTQGYQRWCEGAFGAMLHHTPAEVLGRDARRNDGLRRTWYWACKEESIDPRTPTRLPLLFALDAKFAVAGGFHYTPDCSAIDRASGSDAYCGTSFADGDGASGDSGGYPGDAQGLGGSESSSFEGGASTIDSSGGSDGGGDGGGGCGGGCGGGGGD